MFWNHFGNMFLMTRSRMIFGHSAIRSYCRKARPTSQEALEVQDADSLPMPPPRFPSHDWIGPADKKSNLRHIIPAQPKNETKAERDYREMREVTMEWNHQFWSLQNERFIKAKEDFVRGRLDQKKRELEDMGESEELSPGMKQVLSAEEMAEFYQQFLKENRETFQDYNKQWYRRNFSLLWPAVRANVHRLMNRDKR